MPIPDSLLSSVLFAFLITVPGFVFYRIVMAFITRFIGNTFAGQSTLPKMGNFEKTSYSLLGAGFSLIIVFLLQPSLVDSLSSTNNTSQQLDLLMDFSGDLLFVSIVLGALTGFLIYAYLYYKWHKLDDRGDERVMVVMKDGRVLFGDFPTREDLFFEKVRFIPEPSPELTYLKNVEIDEMTEPTEVVIYADAIAEMYCLERDGCW